MIYYQKKIKINMIDGCNVSQYSNLTNIDIGADN